jgi:hypothetical protein
MVMGIASTLALILVVIKALGLTTLGWGWCLAGFGVDIVLFLACVTGGYLFSKKVTKGLDRELGNFSREVRVKRDRDFEERFNRAKDKLG